MTRIGRISANSDAAMPRVSRLRRVSSPRIVRLPQYGSLRTAMLETCVTLSPITLRITGVTMPQS